jgi:polysaccharide export outer membrane protein
MKTLVGTLMVVVLVSTGGASALDAARDYRVGVGDMLHVTVAGDPSVSQSTRVQTTGTARLPQVGDVFVAGLSVVEIEHALDARLRREGVDGHAAIEVVDYQSQAVMVVGAVDRPGRQPLRGSTSLVEVLAASGGLTASASGEVVIMRLDGISLKVRLSAPAAMTEDALAGLDIPLEPGDLISVSPKRYVTVEGEVGRPGSFAIGEASMLTWAIARAGGLARAAARTVSVRRVAFGANPTEIPVDVKAIQRGESPDFVLQAGDLVTVKHRIF